MSAFYRNLNPVVIPMQSELESVNLSHLYCLENIIHFFNLENDFILGTCGKLVTLAMSFLSLSCRMTHPGEGLSPAVVKDMFESGNQMITQEGFGLNLSRKLLAMMNGHIQYVREHNKCYFLIDIELKTKTRRQHDSRASTSKNT